MGEDDRLGLALSGGGHRASCWAAGAVLGIVDAQLNERIVSISSVSGGSITNGVLAAGGDLRAAGRDQVEESLRPGLRQWAHKGLFFPGSATDGWTAITLGWLAAAVGAVTAALLATLAASRAWSGSTVIWVGVAALGVMILLTAALALKLLPSLRIILGVALGAVVVLPFVAGAVAGATASAVWLVLLWPAALVFFWSAVRRFGGRSLAVVKALGRTLFAGSSGPLGLDALSNRPVHHVFCATDLNTGNTLYLTNRLTWGHPDVLARPGGVTLATAVQGSACLPGAFLARSIEPLPSDPPVSRAVVLSDGGAYDNMADQWEWGYANRRQNVEAFPGGVDLLASAQPDPATHLIVVNASKGMTDVGDIHTKPGLKGELASAMGAKDVLYDVSTATRRRLLIDVFERSRAGTTDELGGMLVHIGTSPYAVVDQFAKRGGDDAGRARAARSLLDGLTDLEWPDPSADGDSRRKAWRKVAKANAAVKTTLAPLEKLAPGSTAALLHHAWVLTRITAFVVHDWGALPLRGVPDDWRRARFETLVAVSASSA